MTRLARAARARAPNVKRVIAELVAIIDYLAPPCAGEPGKRARIGFESGPHGVKGGPPGAWDGGKLWTKTDRRIALAIRTARRVLAGRSA